MSKAVLISIKPHWVGLIYMGKKTIEVRKSKPNLKTPFRCYIYQSKMILPKYLTPDRISAQKIGGLVVGEFTCNKILEYKYPSCYNEREASAFFKRFACLTDTEVWNYGKGDTLYGWHIFDVKMYDKPKELSEFRLWNRPECAYGDSGYAKPKSCNGCNNPPCHVQRAFQSWGYVEELP